MPGPATYLAAVAGLDGAIRALPAGRPLTDGLAAVWEALPLPDRCLYPSLQVLIPLPLTDGLASVWEALPLPDRCLYPSLQVRMPLPAGPPLTDGLASVWEALPLPDRCLYPSL